MPPTPSFLDVSEAHPFHEEVEWMAEEGDAEGASAPVRLPDPPALVTEPRDDAASGTAVDVPEDDLDPVDDLPPALVAVGDGLRTHRTTVRELRERAAAADRETADAGSTSRHPMPIGSGP